MANLISVTVFTPSSNPNAPVTYTSAAQVINVAKIQSVVADSTTSGVNSAIDYSYNVGNLFQSKTLLVNEAASAIVTAANA